MNKLTIAATTLGSLVVASILFLAVLPNEMHVSRTAVVHGDPQAVTRLVSHLPERLDWVAWTEIDPEAAYTFDGAPGALGSTMAWVGDEIGTAELTLDAVDPGKGVVTTLVYEAPFTMTTHDRFTFQAVPQGTRVTWTATAPLAFGPERIFGLFADSIIGPDYERGLERMDALLLERNNLASSVSGR